MMRLLCLIGLLALPNLILASVATRVGALYGMLAVKQYCEQNPDKCKKEDIRFGVGGHYVDSAQINTTSYGGYINLDMIMVSSENNRTKAVLSGKLGWDKHTFASTSPSVVKSSRDLAMFFELRPKVGLNLASKEVPLFLNLAYTLEGYSTKQNQGGYANLLHQVGVELEGALPTQSGFTIEYALGYDYLFAGSYKFGEVSGNSAINNGYTLRASLGFSHKLTENTLYYVRAIGKYHNLSTSKPLDSNGVNLSMPATQNYVGMIEFGIGF